MNDNHFKFKKIICQYLFLYLKCKIFSGIYFDYLFCRLNYFVLSILKASVSFNLLVNEHYHISFFSEQWTLINILADYRISNEINVG